MFLHALRLSRTFQRRFPSEVVDPACCVSGIVGPTDLAAAEFRTDNRLSHSLDEFDSVRRVGRVIIEDLGLRFAIRLHFAHRPREEMGLVTAIAPER